MLTERNYPFFLLLYLLSYAATDRRPSKQPPPSLCLPSPCPKVVLNVLFTLLRICSPRWARSSGTPLTMTKVEDQRFAHPHTFFLGCQFLPFAHLQFCLNAHNSIRYWDSILTGNCRGCLFNKIRSFGCS
jgi:hypothetical protein